MDILIVEDEAEIAQLIQLTLEKEGFSCQISRDGILALQIFQERSPDLIILDLMLPGLDGLEVCARIRQKPGKKDPYILMLTAKGEEIDRVIGLSTGADDYMVKPFSPRELVARVRALLRRSLRQGGQHPLYRTQHFIVDVEQRTISRQINSQLPPETLELTALEFNLLSTLVSNPGRVWNRTQLIDKLWGDNFFGDDRVVDTHVARLRKKIELDPANPTFVKTVVGVGYKFEDPPVFGHGV
ncbi:response regulator transcription factor [Aetokthonos hydrillicola Thurmond2011]|jgi:two-component system OmpR family response regulator|uniref:Response regulator transcription factor n=2 Tax=Aetokthonos hydrillicola Thurmond2011 TaxID=2712845 RepID=A0AAP5IEJ0_9CYAN|nr:response regulator transcription factor [Aetokthonos hydrillicola]MBO3457179.1 response regulator transcription factor [Aetokthonos hydrillicola CCALA 1050]MBW4587530.1 response regulator transcription factor [Aetokthonos hydrillicola CCALA 1050]MDR9898602.1 response regulator transcription factor [Aetokthonos hydrillicola Thurmond2011]